MARGNPNGHIESLKHYQPRWKAGKTKAIRIPEIFVDQVMEYVRKLDEDYIKIDEDCMKL